MLEFNFKYIYTKTMDSYELRYHFSSNKYVSFIKIDDNWICNSCTDPDININDCSLDIPNLTFRTERYKPYKIPDLLLGNYYIDYNMSMPNTIRNYDLKASDVII